MKLHTRVFSTFLALLMMLGSFTFLSVLPVGAADLSEDSIKKTYTSRVYNTPEEKLDDMTMMLARNGYQLWVDSMTGEIAVVDTAGQILFSNPYDLASAKGSVDVKSQILSQISVQYQENGKSTALYSFPEAAVRNQIFVSSIKNGVRVEYTVGREESRKLVPRWISKERFETYIKAPLVEAVAKGELDDYWAKKVYRDYYELKSIAALKSERAKQQLIAEYPICEVLDIYVLLFDTSSELNMLESYIKAYCEDYSFEMMDADHEETGYPAQDERYPMFKMALEYSLDEDGLSVRMPCNGLRYDMTNYPLESISILPFMGAGNGVNEGYTFFPDGSGSLFAYKDVALNEHIEVTGKIYGVDYAYHNIESVAGTYQKVIRYPVYGAVSTETIYTYQYTRFDPQSKTTSEPITEVVSNTVKSLEKIKEELADENITQLTEISAETYQRGYVAIIEKGDSLGSLQVYAPGGSSTYNTIRNFFDPKPRDSYVVTDALSVNNNSVWNITSNRKYTGSITIAYHMLSDTDIAEAYKAETGNANYTYYETNWLGMAEVYRDYLCSEEVGILKPLTAADVEADIPMYIETFGAMATQSSFMTIPVTVMTPFTTFEDVKTMYSELSEAGVNNINFRLTGYANGGMYATVPAKLKWEKNVGGKSGFEDLVAHMNSVNTDAAKHLGIYPDFDFAYLTGDTLFDSTNLKKDAVKTIDNRYTSKRMYSATQQKYISFYQLAISPSRYDKFYNKLLKNYSEYDIKMMSIASLGSALNSDFDEEDPYNREDSKDFTVEAFRDLETAGYSLMTEGGNAYTWKYVDHMINMDLDSSRYVKASAAVPFIGAVLHGYVQFAGTPYNEEGDTDYALLKAIENGAGLYFILSYRNTQELKEDLFLSQYYSVRYDIWFEDMVDVYNELNSVMKDLQTSVIVDHYFIDGERVPDVDELRADILKQLEDSLKAEADKEQNATTEALVSIADARTCTANLYKNLEAVIEEMKELNDSLTAQTGFYTELTKDKAALERAVSRLLTKLNDVAGDLENEEVVTLLDSLNRAIVSVKTHSSNALALYYQIQDLAEEANRLYSEAEAAIEIIRGAKKVNPALSDELVAALVAEAQGYVDAAEPLLAGIDTDADAEGAPDFGVEIELNRNAEYFAQTGTTSIFVIAMDALTVVTAVGSEYEEYDQLLKEQTADSFFTVQDIIDTADSLANLGNKEEEEAVTGESSKYKVDPNSVVVVSYGQRDSATHNKTVEKTFILNYNNYAVRVTYAGTNITYTIPAGGYVVIG